MLFGATMAFFSLSSRGRVETDCYQALGLPSQLVMPSASRPGYSRWKPLLPRMLWRVRT